MIRLRHFDQDPTNEGAKELTMQAGFIYYDDLQKAKKHVKPLSACSGYFALYDDKGEQIAGFVNSQQVQGY